MSQCPGFTARGRLSCQQTCLVWSRQLLARRKPVKTSIARRVLVTFAVAAVTGPVAGQAALAAAGDARPQAVAALRQGPLMAWGYNGLGGLGIGNTQNQDLPIAVN